MTDAFLAETELLLRAAYEKLDVNSGNEPLSSAAARIVQCAIEAVTILDQPSMVSAGEMISCARAAVTAATYAMREVDGRDRRRRVPGYARVGVDDSALEPS